MIEPTVGMKSLLYQNWSLTSPARDNATLETFDPARVHFTTREYASNPRRVHSFQVSVLAGPRRTIPEEVGSTVMYRVEEQIEIHVWSVAGIGDDWDTVRQSHRNMLDETDLIIRLAATGVPGVQFVRLTPGWRELDETSRALVLHKSVEVTGVYYRTETVLPPLPVFPAWDVPGWSWDDGVSQWS